MLYWNLKVQRKLVFSPYILHFSQTAASFPTWVSYCAIPHLYGHQHLHTQSQFFHIFSLWTATPWLPLTTSEDHICHFSSTVHPQDDGIPGILCWPWKQAWEMYNLVRKWGQSLCLGSPCHQECPSPGVEDSSQGTTRGKPSRAWNLSPVLKPCPCGRNGTY